MTRIFNELKDTVKRQEDRINEIQESLIVFAVPGPDLIYRVDPNYVDIVRPFLEEIEQLRAANAATRDAIRKARSIWNDLAENDILKGTIQAGSNPADPFELVGDPWTALTEVIGSLHQKRAAAITELKSFNTTNPDTLLPEIAPENRERAEMLREEILRIPPQVEILEKARSETNKLLTLPEMRILNRGYNKIPTRGGVKVPKTIPEMFMEIGPERK